MLYCEKIKQTATFSLGDEFQFFSWQTCPSSACKPGASSVSWRGHCTKRCTPCCRNWGCPMWFGQHLEISISWLLMWLARSHVALLSHLLELLFCNIVRLLQQDRREVVPSSQMHHNSTIVVHRRNSLRSLHQDHPFVILSCFCLFTFLSSYHFSSFHILKYFLLVPTF